nr:MAG TPA: hypothetical protein [Caudoviricetes sp.]DAI24907.1 MAG TPA: hypothetical protein [Caudoviricetes sp.]DAN53546.1 MAG TPA: hypothetical protein [Caudoviricetes sp.]DAP30180.1 MAG TPA: hypothetical protein [Caudoviricetes sp.]
MPATSCSGRLSAHLPFTRRCVLSMRASKSYRQ